MAACPACGNALEARTLDAHYGRTVTIDLCGACHGFWFDGLEQLQLSPGATLRIFRELAAATPTEATLRDRKVCPRCGKGLTRTVDRRQSTIYESHRCARGCGRFMSFPAFLRSKHFVRDLTPPEIAQLRRHLQFARCPSCGASVDIRLDAACGYCRAPLAVLDPDQISKAITALDAAEVERTTIDPSWPLRAAHARLEASRAFKDAAPARSWEGGINLLDISVAGVARLLMKLARKGD